MKSEPTPRPWRWFSNAHGGARVDAEGAGIADVLSRAGVAHPIQETCEANAALIAAAPDLLAACEAAAHAFEQYEDEGPLNAQLRTAIARARGR